MNQIFHQCEFDLSVKCQDYINEKRFIDRTPAEKPVLIACMKYQHGQCTDDEIQLLEIILLNNFES